MKSKKEKNLLRAASCNPNIYNSTPPAAGHSLLILYSYVSVISSAASCYYGGGLLHVHHLSPNGW